MRYAGEYPRVAIDVMTKIEPCLLGCDTALAEADRLMHLLCGYSRPLDPEITALRRRIAALRKEVERLRGITSVRAERRMNTDWIDPSHIGSPWAAPDRGPTVIDSPGEG